MFKYLFLVTLSAFLFTGCAMVSSPVNGGIYTNVTAPLTATSVQAGDKEGRAVCKSILGIAAYGDCSVKKAAANGGISEISSVSYNAFSILIFYSEYETIVTGK